MSQIKKSVLDSFNTTVIEANTVTVNMSDCAHSIVNHNTGNITKSDWESHINLVLRFIHEREQENECDSERISKRDGLDMFERAGIAFADANSQVRFENHAAEGSRLVPKNMVVLLQFDDIHDSTINEIQIKLYATHYHKQNDKLESITTKVFSYAFYPNYKLVDGKLVLSRIDVQILSKWDE